METDKKIISLNHQKNYEELTNLVDNTSTEEVYKQIYAHVNTNHLPNIANEHFTTFVHR